MISSTLSSRAYFSKRTQGKIVAFLDTVLEESSKHMGMCMPGYQLTLDPFEPFIKRRDGKIQFLVYEATRDSGGGIRRGGNWTGFWNIAERVLEEMDPVHAQWVELTIRLSDRLLRRAL